MTKIQQQVFHDNDNRHLIINGDDNHPKESNKSRNIRMDDPDTLSSFIVAFQRDIASVENVYGDMTSEQYVEACTSFLIADSIISDDKITNLDLVDFINELCVKRNVPKCKDKPVTDTSLKIKIHFEFLDLICPDREDTCYRENMDVNGIFHFDTGHLSDMELRNTLDTFCGRIYTFSAAYYTGKTTEVPSTSPTKQLSISPTTPPTSTPSTSTPPTSTPTIEPTRIPPVFVPTTSPASNPAIEGAKQPTTILGSKLPTKSPTFIVSQPGSSRIFNSAFVAGSLIAFILLILLLSRVRNIMKRRAVRRQFLSPSTIRETRSMADSFDDDYAEYDFGSDPNLRSDSELDGFREVGGDSDFFDDNALDDIDLDEHYMYKSTRSVMIS